MKNKIYILIIFTILVFSFFVFYFYYLKKIPLKEKIPISTSTSSISYQPKYQIIDNEVIGLSKWNINKSGALIEGVPKGTKIYMPFDGTIYFTQEKGYYGENYINMGIEDSTKNILVAITGNFEPINLTPNKKIFASKGRVIGEVKDPQKELGTNYLQIIVYNNNKIDLELLKDFFPNLK